MSNYSQTTFFTPKDSLPPSNPAKTIFGAAYDVEFGNISTAIASKYDSSSIQAGQVAFGLGSSTLPSITFVGFTGTGWSSDGSGDLIGSTAGVARLTIFANGGVVLAAATGASEGAGTLNATGLFINGVAVVAGSGAGGVSSIAGTASQIAASSSTGAVTLSMPQNVIIPTPASGTALTLTCALTFAALNSQGAIICGGNTLSHSNQTVTNTQVIIQGGSAEIVSINGAAGTDLKVWSNFADTSGVYHFRLENDALSTVQDWMSVTRTSATSAVVAIVNSQLTVTAPSGQSLVQQVFSTGTFAVSQITAPSSSSSYFQAAVASSNSAYMGMNGNAGTDSNGFGSGHIGFGSPNAVTLDLTTNALARIRIDSAGAVVINAPTAGNALSITGLSGSDTVSIVSVGSANAVDLSAANTTNRVVLQISQTSGNTVVIGLDGSTQVLPGTTAGDFCIRSGQTIRLSANGYVSSQVTLATAGNVTIAAPTSGIGLTVNGISGTHSTKISDSATNLFNAGFLEIPQNSKSAAYTTVLSDSGKHIYHPSADTTARAWVIDSNANVPYPIGTAITFSNDASGGVITLSITSDTLVWLPTGATGSRAIAANGQGTALKVAATRWQLTGTNIT